MRQNQKSNIKMQGVKLMKSLPHSGNSTIVIFDICYLIFGERITL